ncbi:CDP-alcohol phosphatidyltransferase family protein [Parabacteroides sp. AM08-6]|uniref:CDP-alcohol phosphatidyltransferase family protein n=1 Tax=Parabacteroides sp. AM08-6 TaxID=2292053 RepID=UPI000F00DE4B|nr:CDP-alcohol phosphatidyltransferase family protein [Parabacteroides sp. AM08-6]RHJ85478.1 CDP-alcohol phosphatidyltransferase family protein [Parabacteroides sp. AM08-6]
MSDLDKEYEASLKSIETENKIDRVFYRPIGFRIARMLRGTGITPNMVTVISIFVGAAVGFFFYHDDLSYNICGILLLIFANILDCVDGQLARLTGIKSAIGRILDGFAGDIWFASIYVAFALRLSHDYGTHWFFALAVLSGLSHLVQANITDYYKTLHLYFISKDKGAEFQSLEQVRARHKEMKYGINKFFYFLYRGYTLLQVKATPSLQQMLRCLHTRYGDNIPDDIRVDFRKQSKRLMCLIDMLTFNGRTIVMFIVVLLGEVWVYFLYEIIVLNIVLLFAMHRHEKMCATFCK